MITTLQLLVCVSQTVSYNLSNKYYRCSKTKCILFKYKNPLANSVQSINVSVLNEYRNREGLLQGRKYAVLWLTERDVL